LLLIAVTNEKSWARLRGAGFAKGSQIQDHSLKSESSESAIDAFVAKP
jgi:hypothetical protein